VVGKNVEPRTPSTEPRTRALNLRPIEKALSSTTEDGHGVRWQTAWRLPPAENQNGGQIKTGDRSNIRGGVCRYAVLRVRRRECTGSATASVSTVHFKCVDRVCFSLEALIDRSLNSRNLERTGLLDIQHFRTLVLLSDLSPFPLFLLSFGTGKPSGA
jgi:hypothetical protein